MAEPKTRRGRRAGDAAGAPDERSGTEAPAGEAGAGDIRRPQQERGERRVAAILDAAAELLAEVGLEGLTVQVLVERARTSKGSLYHFFPDLASVLRALRERHAAEIAATVAALGAGSADVWRGLSVEETVDRFTSPVLSYLETHPDLLVLARESSAVTRRPEQYAHFLELAETVLCARVGGMEPGRRAACAATMVAVLTGVLAYGMRSPRESYDAMIHELRQVLASYLRSLEEGSGG